MEAAYIGIGRPRIADKSVMVSFRLPKPVLAIYERHAEELKVSRAFCIRAAIDYDEHCGVTLEQWIADKARESRAIVGSTPQRNSRRRRQRIADAFDEHVSLDVVYVEELGICHICRTAVVRRQASLDHVMPLALGGRHSRSNIKLAHQRCNSIKGARLLVETRRRLVASGHAQMCLFYSTES